MGIETTSERVLRTRGAQLTCLDQGTGGPALLFLHYWGGSSRTWGGVVTALAGGPRRVMIDQRGWGRSEALDGRYDLDAMADDVADVVAALGLERFVLVGHSMGGKVAQIVAARGQPGLLGLVLVAPAPPEAMAVPAEQRAAMLISYQSREGVDQAIDVLAGRPLTKDEREQVMADTLAGAPEAKQEWTEWGMIAAIDDTLSAFSGPVRVVVGADDRVERPEVLRAAFARRLPQAVVEVASDAGHLLPIERPDTIAAACRQIVAAVQNS